MDLNPQFIRDLIIRLVKVPSISGTTGELKMAEEISEMLLEIPYFQENPQFVQNHVLPNDSLGRTFVTALLKGRQAGSKTVILLSHYDVVGVHDFGHFEGLAFEPELYTEKLRTEAFEGLDPEAQAELSEGNWLFGRGIMDMKAGLAIQLAVLQEFAQERNFTGNILLLATPDEERNSAGMLAAIPILNQLRRELGLDYELCICSEPSFACFPGDSAKYIYTGAVGKLLPLIFCVGKETHVGESLEGLNAAWMAAEIVNQVELSDQFVDRWQGESSPPPTCLKLTDLKENYNVQTPSLAYVLYNILTLTQSPQDVLAKLKSAALAAGAALSERMAQKYAEVDSPDKGRKLAKLQPKVYTYSELYQRGKNISGFESAIAGVIEAGRRLELDQRLISVNIATELARYFTEEGPFYLLMFAPPYYPHGQLDQASAKDMLVQRMVEQVIAEASEKFAETIKVKKFFTGLSDVSYCRVTQPEQVLPTLQENMPLLDNTYLIPFKDIIELNVPTLNIGPYGKDAHKRTERLEMGFSTQIAPLLLANAISYILREGGKA